MKFLKAENYYVLSAKHIFLYELFYINFVFTLQVVFLYQSK